MNKVNQSKDDLSNLILPYRRRILNSTILLSLCTLCIILERFFKEPITSWEKQNLYKIQEMLGISNTIISLPFYIFASVQEQYVFLLILMHFISWLYFRKSRIIAIKTLSVTYLAWYLLMMLQLFYQQPQPFWVSSSITTFMCDQKYSSPADVTFLPCFIIYYPLYQFTAQKSQYAIAIACHTLYCFFVYLTGEVFLADMFLGLVYFLICYSVLIKIDLKLKKNKMYPLQILMISTSLFLFATIYQALKSYSDDIIWIQNYFKCFQKEPLLGDYQHYRFNTLLGAEATYCQIMILICLATFGFLRLPKERMSVVNFLLLQMCFLPGWIAIILQTFVTRIDILHQMGLSQLAVESVLFSTLHWWIFSFCGAKFSKRSEEDYQLIDD